MQINSESGVRRSAADVVLHPVRLRIVYALADRQLTARQLGAALHDVPQASLYRHLRRLMDAEVIMVAEEMPAPGGVRRAYALTDARVEIADETLAGAGPGDHLRYFTAFTGALVAGFERYVSSPEARIDPGGIWYGQVSLWLSPQEARRLDTMLSQALESFAANEAGGDRRRVSAAVVVHPNPGPTE